MSRVSVKTLHPCAIRSMLAIEQAAHQNPWSLDLIQDCFSSDYFILGIYREHKLMGYLIAQMMLDEASLLNICVDPAYQRQGCGRLLLENFVVAMQDRGVTQCFLEVRASNHCAQKLYTQFGFESAGLRKNYYRVPHTSQREDAVLMTASLAI